jgi:hypothetical protein
MAETNLKAGMELRELPQLYLLDVGLMILLASIAAFTKNKRFHAFFAPFWLAILLLYLGFTTLSKIAT